MEIPENVAGRDVEELQPSASGRQSPTRAGSREPPAHLSLLTSHRFLHDLPLIEIDLFGADDLIGLMALAGEKDRVAAPPRSAPLNGGQPICDPQVGHASHSLLDIIDDGVGIFGAGVVGRHDGQVRDAPRRSGP